MATFKIIFSGSLDFGSERSYTKVFELYFQRAETHFRNSVLINDEELFFEERRTLEIPRLIVELDNRKPWDNSVKLLEYIAQFAMAGQIDTWLISDHKLIAHAVIEPNADKIAINNFKKGRKLISIEGKEEEARKALSKAIEKFERHAAAYERRGYINFRLTNIEDAIYDFTKSIAITPNAMAYFGRANCLFTKGEYAKALEDLTEAHTKSIPHQPIFWKSRRMKAECLFLLGKYENAIKEYKYVTNRKFKEDDPNYKWLKHAYSNKGKAYLALKNFAEAEKAFTDALKAIDLAEQTSYPSRAQILTLRAEARDKGGLKGVKEDLAAAKKA